MPRYLLGIVLLALASCSTGFAQLYLTGRITGATGEIGDYMAPGDSIRIAVDITPPLEDIFGGGAADRGIAGYNRAVTIEVENRIGLPLPLGAGGIFFYDAPHLTEGLFISSGWSGSWQLHPSPTDFDFPFLRSTSYILPPGHFTQQFLSNNDVMPSLSELPANLPMSAFFNTEGFYELTSTYPYGHGGGRVDWTVTAYQFGDAPLSPVPESSLFGICGATILLGLVFYRNRRSRLRFGSVT